MHRDIPLLLQLLGSSSIMLKICYSALNQCLLCSIKSSSGSQSLVAQSMISTHKHSIWSLYDVSLRLMFEASV